VGLALEVGSAKRDQAECVPAHVKVQSLLRWPLRADIPCRQLGGDVGAPAYPRCERPL